MIEFFGENNSWISDGDISVDMREIVRIINHSHFQCYYMLRGIGELFPCSFEIYQAIKKFKTNKE